MHNSLGKVGKAVSDKIHYLESIKTTGPGKALLAQLRRGLGKKIDEAPEIWGIVLENLWDDNFRDEGGVRGYEEAIYGALTLYALACQSVEKDDSAQCDGISFGYAVGKLVEDESDRKRIDTRMKSILKARSPFESAVRMRSMLPLIYRAGQKIDFALLADDLYRLSYSDSRKKVWMKWARAYIRGIQENQKNSVNEEEK